MEGASSEISHPSTRRQKFNGTLSATRDDEKYRHANDLCGDYVLKTDVPIITYFDNLLFRFATQKLPVNACERLAKLSLRFSKLKLTSPHARRLLATMDFVLAYEAIKTQLQPRGELARRQAALMQMKNLGLEPDPSRAVGKTIRRGSKKSSKASPFGWTFWSRNRRWRVARSKSRTSQPKSCPAWIARLQQRAECS